RSAAASAADVYVPGAYERRRKARSRATSDDELSPLPHPTTTTTSPAILPFPAPYPAYTHDPHAQQESTLAALSTLATSELHALEQEEALRRAEYAVRHQALRARQRHAEILASYGRRARSAATSPLGSPGGGAGAAAYFDLPPAAAPGHAVDGPREHAPHAHGISHPYASPAYAAAHRPRSTHDGRAALPRPRSLHDVAGLAHPPLLPPPPLAHAHAHSRSATHIPALASSGADALGLGALAIHSSAPSRAASPQPDFQQHVYFRERAEYATHFSPVHIAHAHAQQTGQRTPQLSSGPSSEGSSPSLPHLSRPSSPPHFHPSPSHFAPLSSSGTGGSGSPPAPKHLAHSVRAAFGMTPIHPLPPAAAARLSPPIRLAPLLDEGEEGERERERERLPGFSELVAAGR
ncbi:hypothetical protein K488DRAFT_85546, partial [Vararia minispora EC-137]